MDFARLAIYAPAIVVAISFHEYAHARAALAMGDTTAASQGRVTLNPLSHLDPLGTVAIFFTAIAGVGIGWGRPVPVNPHAYRHPRGELVVSAAGPAMNLALAALSGLIWHLLPLSVRLGQDPASMFIAQFLIIMVYLNLALAFFNLIPLHPLDGSHALANLLPLDKALRFEAFNRSYGMQVLLALLMLGWITDLSPIGIVVGLPVHTLGTLILNF
jgi:Zn-dependent protease